MSRGALLVWAAAALLGACASPPQTDDASPWTSGRLSVRIDASGAIAARSVSSAFELRGSAERGELRLISPLGTQMAAARWAPGQAVLATSEGEQSFASLDELSRAALGEALPLAALPDWLAGRPWASAAHQVRDDGFDQLGWRVLLTRRTEGWVEARRDAPPAVTVRVKLDAVEP